MRVLLEHDPFERGAERAFEQAGLWPARWIHLLGSDARPFFAAYKCAFSLPEARTVRVHVSADERYRLFLDGQRVGVGPERGDALAWCFESYDLDLAAGEHLFVAQVWSLGEGAAFAQMSVRHGFLLCPDDAELVPLLATGYAPWAGKVLGGLESRDKLCAWGTGDKLRVNGALYPWGFERGEGDWGAVEMAGTGARAGAIPNERQVHFLVPAMLPPMLDEPRVGFRAVHVSATPAPTSEVPLRNVDDFAGERAAWQEFLSGARALDIPPHTARRVLVKLDDYFCAFPELTVSGGAGAAVRIHWSEGLFENLTDWNKGHRDDWEGKFFTAMWNKRDGVGDEFLPDGGQNRTFSTLWWEAGLWLEWQIETRDEPLCLERFALRETRYPLEMESRFACDDAEVTAMIPIMVRALQMCAHETYMDCPFFEQLMYIGDTRLEVLLTYALTGDTRLPKKALRAFDHSRVRSGLTQSRYPSNVLQIIPPFSLWWVCMVHDFALWRDEPEFVASLLPGVRAVCDYFAGLIRAEDGLMGAPDGWNFADWVGMTAFRREGEPHWESGIPPEGSRGVSAILNLQFVLALQAAAQVEEWHGEAELAALQNRRALALFEAVQTHFWREERGLFADDLSGAHWSEHAQCLAVLTGLLSEERRAQVERGLFEAPDLARTTIYFSHYLFEACRVLGRMDKFFARLEDWNTLVHNGLKTTIESPEPTRSDCHAWGAHPLFHFFASVAGVRPTAPGFKRFQFAPQLGTLGHIEGELPHPQGTISFRVSTHETHVSAPAGVEQD